MYRKRKEGMENIVIPVMLPRSKPVAAFSIDVLIVNRPENGMIPYIIG